jgi:hypothetical protein
MNYFRIIISVLFMVQATLMEAKWPDDFMVSEEKSSTVLSLNKRSRIFATFNPIKSVSSFYYSKELSPVNREFVTGVIKKEENDFARLLHWDFKVKFQLSKNINIIFSYN